MNNYIIRIVDGKKVGYLKTSTSKFSLGEDGQVFISPLGSNTRFKCGQFIGGSLEQIPNQYVGRVSKVLEKLTYMQTDLSKQ